MQPYKQAYNQAQAMQGAGVQNMIGGLQQGAGSFDQMQAQKLQSDYLSTLNAPGASNPMTQVGGNYTSPSGQQSQGSGYTSAPNATVPTYQQQMNQWDVNQFNSQNPYINKIPSINPFLIK